MSKAPHEVSDRYVPDLHLVRKYQEKHTVLVCLSKITATTYRASMAILAAVKRNNITVNDSNNFLLVVMQIRKSANVILWT